MSKFLATYDPARVSVLLFETELYGWPEGEMVTVERNQPHFLNHVGTRGETSRAVVRDNSGIITVRLQSTSPSVEFIEAMKTTNAVMQVAGVGAAPVGTFRIVDPSSNAQVMAAYVWLNETGTLSWGNEVGVIEYKFFAVNIVTAPNQALSAVQSVASLLNIG